MVEIKRSRFDLRGENRRPSSLGNGLTTRSAILGVVMMAVLGAFATARAQAPAQAPSANPYGPYKFLIGEWLAGPDGGAPAAVITFRWGPNQSYIWMATSLINKGVEEPHFEGILIWNGVHKNLDMLLTLDLRNGQVQEQGTASVEPDGTVVRNITAVYSEGVRLPPTFATAAGPEGAIEHNRQTYKADGPDRILTTAMLNTKNGWVPTFPGSDHLVMERKPKK